jgi:hypothetical protein
MTQKLPLLLRLAFFVAVILLLASSPHATYSQTARTSSPDCHASLSKAKLVSSGEGWAIVKQPSDRAQDHATDSEDCTDEHLYWTDNDGQSWREITPDRMPARNLGSVFFLDRVHGWMISPDSGRGESNAPIHIVYTEDGGKGWRTVLLQRPLVNSITDMSPMEIFFSDASHGWILWRWAQMHSRANALTATSDGGRTWRTLPEPPGPGPMQFTSAQNGWIIGDSAGQVGVPIIERDQVWATRDGGEHWSAIFIPVPADAPDSVRFGELKFNDKGEGVVAAQSWVSNYVERFFTCVTHDGGGSWRFSQFDGYGASPSLVGTHVVWTVFHWPVAPTTIRIGDREIAPAIPEILSLQGQLGNLNFIDDSSAWAIYANGRIRPLMPPVPFELLSTTDGGKTFRTITPPAASRYPVPAPELFSLNGSVVRFPPRPAFGMRPPPIPPNGGGLLRFAPPAGGPMIMTGTGFRQENTVWIGSHRIQVASNDGENLQFLVPLDVAPGTYKIYVENSSGKTNETEVSIRAPQALKISNIQNGEGIRPGQQISLIGSGFLLENKVWFGTQGVAAKLIISGAPILQVSVPASVPKGRCEIYVSNATGKSDSVGVMIE